MANTLHEVSRRTIVITKYEEPAMLWNKSVLTIRTDKGVSCIEYTHNLRCLDKNIDCTESIVPTSKSSPVTDYLTNNSFIKKGLSNMELSQLALDPSFWPYSPHIVEEMVSVVSFDWSPTDLCFNNKSVLAVLNNIGNVELFCPHRCTLVSALDISKHVNKLFDVVSNIPKCFNDLREVVETVVSTAICWAPKLNPDGSCYFVTVQKNGNILLWLIKRDILLLKAEYFCSIQVKSSEITTIQWINKLDHTFILVYSNMVGEIVALNCKIGENVEVMSKHTLWAHKDRMIAKNLQYIVIDNKIIFTCTKHRHFIAILLDMDCNILSQFVKNVNDYKITVNTKCGDQFYIGTVNCEVYKVNVTISNNNLDVKISMVHLKETYANYELYGLTFSSNNVICSLGLLNRKILIRKDYMKIEIILLCTDTNYANEVEVLLNNPTKTLTNMWDYVELFRYKCMKTRSLPVLDFKQILEEAETNIYKLKIYLIIAIIYDTLQINLKLYKGLLPECSIELIQDKIMALHAQSRVKELYKLYLDKKFPNDFLAETFTSLVNYLKYYCKKYDKNLKEYIPVDRTKDYKYVCQCCDNFLDGFTCSNGHLNMFCSLTFTPIETCNYLVCNSNCGITARIELYNDKPICVLCDTHLDLCNLPN
ncbi:uncharacterized protein LOC113522223 [Galleria mellonella]|uniref:Uncharacterized protein LOC113522223 n=1 Tax=Galleria mellonella TaxID=7137 RepID=A0A6J1X8H4_GALME|nr:uncharacterized protein LOC113522223 [Galleria mellonella]